MTKTKAYTDEEVVAAFNTVFRERGMAHRLVIVDGHVIHKDLTPEEIEQERKELEVAQ